MRIVVYHNAPHWDDCGGIEVWLEPEGRNAEADFVSYPGYKASGRIFPAEWMRRLGYVDAPKELVARLEE